VSSPAAIWQYRTLVANLTRRDLKAKYRKSILGQLWSLINPATTLGIYTLVFGIIFQTVAPLAGNGHTNSFALYLFAALVVWNFFSNGISSSIDGFQGAGPLLNKIYFAPEGPVLAVVLGLVVQLGFEVSILVFIMALVGNLSWTFLLFPLIAVPLFLLALGLGMVAAILNVFYRDVRYLVGLLLQLAFYATPIVYKIDQVPERKFGVPLRSIFQLNPLARFVAYSRDIFYTHEIPSALGLLYVWLISLAVFFLGWWYFSRRAAQAVEEL